MPSMSGAIQDLPCRKAHFMFLGEAPRNVRERRRFGEERNAPFVASLASLLRAWMGAASMAVPAAFVRHE